MKKNSLKTIAAIILFTSGCFQILGQNTDLKGKSERIICDVSLKSAKVREYNSQYKPIGQNKWVDRRGDKTYTIEIMEEKWSFVVSIVSEK